MNPSFPGLLIRKERLVHNWSQQGLCQGVCTVSYLSKIEQGKAVPGDDILTLLFSRLGVVWQTDEAAQRKAARIVDQAYDALFSANPAAEETAKQALDHSWTLCTQGPSLLDALLLGRYYLERSDPLLAECEDLLEGRQRTVYLYLEQRFSELLSYDPSAFSCLVVGNDAYANGHYTLATELLQRGCDLAARDGQLYLMLHCRMILGNCCSDLGDFERMLTHYRASMRMAEAVGHDDFAESIRYNIAATNLERGNVQEAYAFFSEQPEKNVMSLHKYAICCERLGKIEEAHKALDAVENAPCPYPDRALALQLCELIRFRLTNKDYLHCSDYGDLLLSSFSEMRRTLPAGYARFHLPWVIAWYKASRQYKQACELLQEFPAYGILSVF